MQRMGLVRTVLYITSLEPLESGGTNDIEDLGGLAVEQPGTTDFRPNFRGWYGLGDECVNSWTEVYGMCCNRSDDRGGKPAVNSSSTTLVRNRAILRQGI